MQNSIDEESLQPSAIFENDLCLSVELCFRLDIDRRRAEEGAGYSSETQKWENSTHLIFDVVSCDMSQVKPTRFNPTFTVP